MKEYILIPRKKDGWVGKKYEDAILVGFGKYEPSLLLLTKLKGKPRTKSVTSWAVHFWKVPPRKRNLTNHA